MLHPVVQSFILILYTLHNLIKLWNLYQISLGTLQCIAVAINHITVLLQILRIGSSNDHPRRNSIIDSESHASIKLRLCGRRNELCLWPLSADHKVNASAAPGLRYPLHRLEERILHNIDRLEAKYAILADKVKVNAYLPARLRRAITLNNFYTAAHRSYGVHSEIYGKISSATLKIIEDLYNIKK